MYKINVLEPCAEMQNWAHSDVAKKSSLSKTCGGVVATPRFFAVRAIAPMESAIMVLRA